MQTQPTNQSALLESIGETGFVSADKVLDIRRQIFPDGVISRSELEGIIRLGEKAPTGDPAWPQLFIEVCVSFFLEEEEPAGYITDDEFAYIRNLVTRDGRMASRLELAALIRIIERSVSCPSQMHTFVTDQVRMCITGKHPPSIEANDLALVQCLLYGMGSADSIGISRDEADLLFDINDAVRSADNVPAWQELFVKAIAAHLMQHVGYTPVPRREALRLQAWASDTSASPGRFLQRMVSGGLRAISEAYDGDLGDLEEGWSAKNAQNRQLADLARHVSQDEAQWLIKRMGKDGAFDEAERALLVYIRDHLNAALPESLAGLTDNADAEAA